MNRVWRRIEVDGEEYSWTAYASERRTDDGPWRECVTLMVAGKPGFDGFGRLYPAGTVVEETDVAESIRFMRTNGSAGS